MLTVYNKADLMADDDIDEAEDEDLVLVSAVSGEGLDELVEEIVQHVSPVRV
jgi:50S ribosomal subunit-associated GTPase HflX